MTDRQQALLRILQTQHVGRSHPITGHDLARLLGMVHTRNYERAIQQDIMELRLAGNPICASVRGHLGGYYWPNGTEDLAPYEAQVTAKAANIFKVMRAVLGAARFHEVGQQLLLQIGGEAR